MKDRLKYPINYLLVISLSLLGLSLACDAEMFDLTDREGPGVMDETFPVTEQSISMPEIKIATTLFTVSLQPTHTTGALTEFTHQTTPSEKTNILTKIRYWGYQIELSIDPDFFIIQQNAYSLINGHPELFEMIDAISQEAIWFDGVATDDWNNPNGYDRLNDPSYSQ